MNECGRIYNEALRANQRMAASSTAIALGVYTAAMRKINWNPVKGIPFATANLLAQWKIKDDFDTKTEVEEGKYDRCIDNVPCICP